ncbi:transglycosylase SLT domain-containing protein [Variovorax sp. PCZ-1]|uniref:transglycosylase SLT domain-containing protein n=1 Tax=Variovorax sp. PCZ-1 TaxID=2835533 RepID=UPI001BCDF116|nr:transglycosylase SLT domain-containing protein [Variovorax sp. PCZ-1]MBS7807063.1 transglycosylase SLT domain-containing protein [Variovorax sp. PCZ-1]
MKLSLLSQTLRISLALFAFSITLVAAQTQATLPVPAPVSDAKPVDVSKTPKEADRAPGQQAAPAVQTQEPSVLIDNSTPITATAVFVQPQVHADLWARIRSGFGMPDLNDQFVLSQEQFYGSRPEYITRMTARSSKYLYHIVDELERRQMPMELALLPFIESAFNPQAVSSAKAAGMWQFIPSTGKFFDLKQNAFRDDRRDVLQSTRAALDYLQKLQGMFGDWHLALAAYNWGEGSVGRAIKKNQAAGLGTSYSDLNMPNETRQYVPKLQAMKNIVADPGRFNAQLPNIANHPYFQSVNLSRDMDVQLAARLAEMKVEDFRALNPSANKPVMLASGTPQILLPWDNADVFMRNLQSHRGQAATWTAWRVPATMKAGEAAKRFGMAEDQFRSINNIPPRMLIKAGSTLLVPRGSSQLNQDVSAQVADNAQISLAPEIVLRRASVKARKGDTVASIARRYNVSAAQVAQWNKVSAGAALKANQAVVMYLPVKAKAKSVTRAKARKLAAKAAPAKKAPSVVKKRR